MLDGIPHGRACAVFDGDFIRYNLRDPKGAERLKALARHLGEDAEVIADRLTSLSGVKLSLSEDEIEKYVGLVRDARNYQNSPYVISSDEMKEIYRSHFA